MAKIDEYKHPQWQKKRLEALEHYGFQCQKCMSVKKTLHVHHKTYQKGKKIWECDISNLNVVCEDCHKEIEDFVSFARSNGVELLLVIDEVMGLGTPKELLQMFVDYNAGQFDPKARGAFTVAVSGIGSAMEYQRGENAG